MGPDGQHAVDKGSRSYCTAHAFSLREMQAAPRTPTHLFLLLAQGACTDHLALLVGQIA